MSNLKTHRVVVTPLIARAINLQSGPLFVFLYPYIFRVTCGKEKLIFTERRSWSWKLIPWCISQVLVTGIIGLGSCVYICFTQSFDLGHVSWVQIHLFNLLIFLVLGMLGLAEILLHVGLLLSPHLFPALNGIFDLEKQCWFGS